MRTLGGVASLLLAGTLVACGGADPSTDPDPSVAPPTTAAWTDSSVGDECLSETPASPEPQPVEISAPGIRVNAALLAPEGEPVGGVAMLPQVSGGLCGGLRLAAHLTREGILVASMDACGYGDSECAEPSGDGTGPSQEADQVDAAVAALREESGNPELPVVVVGASMGGSLTVRAVAGGADVVGWVDLSGPVSWRGRSLSDLADRVPRGGLVVHAPNDGRPEYRASKKFARLVGADFLSTPDGHGWEMFRDLDGNPNRWADRLRTRILAMLAR